MCGILAIVRCQLGGAAPTAPLLAATHVVRHRGPDDEGYLLWAPGAPARRYAGPETAAASRRAHGLAELPAAVEWRVAYGHRRLSIVDLSPAGHQPMVDRARGLALAYNGEVYNHIELRRELERRGHVFASHCDTEVLLAAWAEWGPACLDRLNGMFAFVLLDPAGEGTLHVVRDRFGVKPLYWGRIGDVIAFASEIKQLRTLPGFAPRLDHRTVRDYLAIGLLDFTRHTFDERVEQLLGGERAVVRLDAPEPRVEVVRWYEPRPAPFRAGPRAAADEFRALLADSVRLRLRADVPVGSCLSGGLDSSAIVCLARRALEEHGEHRGQVTVTARYADPRFDEWQYAEQVVHATEATSVEVWPTVERLQAELDLQLWHMDEPFGSTSQFSQWCVFAGAADAGLKVMLDGQGSDEQLAGYNGNDTALYSGLLRRGSLAGLAGEVLEFRRRHGALPLAQGVLALRNAAPRLDSLLPGRLRLSPERPDWIRLDAPSRLDGRAPRDLNESLRQQTLSTSLPVLLRYEDRTSMARSSESRVPFLDYRLVEFVAGLPDYLKLRRGTTKVVLREGLRGVLPEAVRQRRDKMGFVTPEEVWLTRTAVAWFRRSVSAALDVSPELYEPDRVMRLFDGMSAGKIPFSFLPWRILCLGRWIAELERGAAPAATRTPVHAAS